MKESWYWLVSISASVALLLVLIFLWWQTDSSFRPNVRELVDEPAVYSFLDGLNSTDSEPQKPKPIYLTTGVFLESLKFVSSSDVKVSGYVWQVYHDDIHAGISRDFVLPEMVDSTETSMKEIAYRRRVGKQEVIGWYIEATLRQEFVYAKYPLDHKTVWLRLWHKDFDRNIVLIPDFKSYTGPFNAGQVFAINKHIVLGGWRLEETFFDYNLSDYDTNFGLRNYVGREGFPELQFNLVLKREFVDALVINLVSLMVVAILMFSVVMLTTANRKKAEVFGFDTAMVFGTCSALFFVVMLSHIQLREQFSGTGVVYMEYFYILMYFVILAVAVDAYCFTGKSVAQDANGSAGNPDNLLSKLLYWPLLLGASVAITYLALDA